MSIFDIICDQHRAIILETRIWPQHYLPTDGSCPGCENACATQPQGLHESLPGLDQTVAAAIHEAGHVVVAVAVNALDVFASMEPSSDPKSTAHYGARLTSEDVHSVKHFAIMRAGEAAVRAWLLRDGHCGDVGLLGAVAGGRGDAADLWAAGGGISLAESLAIADQAVAERWCSVKVVADELLRRGRLDGDEIRNLMNCEVAA